MSKIKISSETVEGFQKIEEKINQLDAAILEQIEAAEYGSVGINCYIKEKWSDDKRVYLPKTVTQITDFGDYIGCYAGDYFFKIKPKDFHYTYLFI